MSILGTIGGMLQVNKPRSGPSTTDRLNSETQALARLQMRSGDSANLIRNAEAKFGDDYKKLLETGTPEQIESLQQITDIQNPVPSDYMLVYGPEKGGDIAFRLTRIANGLLGEDDAYKKDFNWGQADPVYDDSKKFTGELRVPVTVTDKKTGGSYDADFTSDGESTQGKFDRAVAGGDANPLETVKSQTRTLNMDELDEAFLMTKEAIIGASGGDASIERIRQIGSPGQVQEFIDSLFTTEGSRKVFDDVLQSQSNPTRETETGGKNVPLEQTEGMMASAASLTPEDVLSGVGRFEKNSSANIKELIKSGYIYQGGIPFGMDPEKWKAEYNTKTKRDLAYREVEKYNELALSTILTEGLDPFSGPVDAFKQLTKVQTEEEGERFANAKNIYNNKLDRKALKAAFIKDPSKIKEFQADPLAFAEKYKDGTDQNGRSISGVKLDAKEATKLNQDIKKEFNWTPDKAKALKEALARGDREAIVRISTSIIDGKVPSTEIQKQIVSILEKTKNSLSQDGIQKQLNDNIVLAIIASDSSLIASNMGALTSFAQTGLLDIGAATAQTNAQVGMINAKKPDVAISNKIIDFKLFDDKEQLVDATSLVELGMNARSQEDRRSYAIKAGQWVKEWAQANSKTTLWQEVMSFGQSYGSDKNQFSAQPNLSFDGKEFFFLDNRGGRTGGKISADRAQKELGPEGYQLLLAAASRNEESK